MSASAPVPAAFALDGIHHVTAITADAQANADFYVGLLGLRLVKRSINQGNPRVYHLFYGDEYGHPGADITFFAYPGLARGKAGSGMVARVIWRLGSQAAVDFWERRLSDAGVRPWREQDAVIFEDPDGLTNELRMVVGSHDETLSAIHPEIPDEFALQGLHAVRAFGEVEDGTGLDEALGFSLAGEVQGPHRGGLFMPVPPPESRPRRGAGTVHHVAWAIPDDSYGFWQTRLREAGVELVEVVDRYYFRSLYFYLPSGLLFELATLGPGLGVDEPLSTLGSKLSLPPAFESLRGELEASLPPLVDPRERWSAPAAG